MRNLNPYIKREIPLFVRNDILIHVFSSVTPHSGHYVKRSQLMNSDFPLFIRNEESLILSEWKF
jgi:hypothetical protein